VDEDLLEYVNNGHLAGAALDVFHQEPLPVEHPFWNHPKIHITPHVASVSDIESVIPQLLENYKRLREGLPLMNEVSREKGY
jgi:glyoxylate/hydroxypyruvate reductase A